MVFGRRKKQPGPEAVITDDDGYHQGPIAFGLGCGVHLSIVNRVAWNKIGPYFEGPRRDRTSLDLMWGVRDTHGWERATASLFRANHIPKDAELALDLRNRHRYADPARWRLETERLLPTAVPEVSDRQESPDPIGRILRYEERFRADGLLAPGEVVTSVAAFDFARAVTMARWAVGAGYCTTAEAVPKVAEAGRLCRAVYGTWEAFSAGYALGRVLWFDGDKYGSWYQEVLTAHHRLTSDPRSPWVTLPWTPT
ncbi:DUF1266 domain-containing protein [Embleya hyalina]|uniref:DUF1266 domain-containing protein n=1 Tax=Embleya hyalina TaxID=516124 RepID=A0A401YQE6_9ACTN|nr:DUF1266 domain-containing protein [Embleya hyalina]GCD96822.1 hypothetical protein EHYA_04509 [Embleya hyalina]